MFVWRHFCLANSSWPAEHPDPSPRSALFLSPAAVASAAFTVAFVLDVGEGDLDDVQHVLVVQRIEDVFAVAAGLDQVFVFQKL